MLFRESQGLLKISSPYFSANNRDSRKLHGSLSGVFTAESNSYLITEKEVKNIKTETRRYLCN